MDESESYSRIRFVLAQKDDLNILEEIRIRAFQPIFDSFRAILGNTIYEFAQLPEDVAQKELLISLFEEDSVWQTWNAIDEKEIIGFISIKIDEKTKVGEIGLNAIDPAFSNKGVGTFMYNFAVRLMKEAGMKVATVATGGDPAHLPARKAYRKAGFNVDIPSVWMCQELDKE